MFDQSITWLVGQQYGLTARSQQRAFYGHQHLSVEKLAFGVSFFLPFNAVFHYLLAFFMLDRKAIFQKFVVDTKSY